LPFTFSLAYAFDKEFTKTFGLLTQLPRQLAASANPALCVWLALKDA
jgi:hypothetical protein